MSGELSPLTRSLATLRAAWPQAQIPRETVEVYQAALARFDESLLADAVRELVLTSRFFPTCSEIAEKCAECALGLPAPVDAWLDACGQEAPAGMRRTGEGALLVATARRAVGGSWAIKTSENITALRAQFLRFYEQLRAERIRRFIAEGSTDLRELEEVFDV